MSTPAEEPRPAAIRAGGTAAQRTVLSWRRTALGAAAVAALSLHHAARQGSWPFVVPTFFAILTALTATWIAWRRGLQLARSEPAGLAPYVAALVVVLIASIVSAGVVEVWAR